MALSARIAAIALRGADIAAAALVLAIGALGLLLRAPLRRRPVARGRPRLLAIDSAYSLDVMRARGAEHFVTHRDLDGYFEHVWNVHPLIGARADCAPQVAVGPPVVTALNAAHTMIEGRVRRFAALERMPYLDFACAQLQLVRMLERIVAREGVGIVRGDPYYHGLLALLLSRLHGRSMEVRILGNYDAIYEATGVLTYPRMFPWRGLEQRVARFTMSRADSVVIGSDDHRAFALRNGARPDRVTHLANGSMVSPIHLSEPRERPRVADEFGFGDRPVVMCVSRLEALKYPQDVVRAVAAARRRDPRIAALIVGEGAMRAELDRLCGELGVQEDIVFAGDRDQRWIASMLTQSSVFAAPLAGLALVESALSGTPIVAYDFDWHSELLRSGQEGLLVPYRDTEAMADAICVLVEDPARAAMMAAAARARVLEFMRPDKLIADERALADRLLASAVATAS
jgi:glycosyltransferase involved in cell wall biosynthesis